MGLNTRETGHFSSIHRVFSPFSDNLSIVSYLLSMNDIIYNISNISHVLMNILVTLFNFHPFGRLPLPVTWAIYNLYTFFELCIFSWFLVQVIRSAECPIIIIPCLTYFRQLFTTREPADLPKEPSLWLVTGIFFYLVTIIPICIATNYMSSHSMRTAAHILYSINNFAFIITYLLFIKGFTCRIKKS
jgi:hypothetical protein